MSAEAEEGAGGGTTRNARGRGREGGGAGVCRGGRGRPTIDLRAAAARAWHPPPPDPSHHPLHPHDAQPSTGEAAPLHHRAREGAAMVREVCVSNVCVRRRCGVSTAPRGQKHALRFIKRWGGALDARRGRARRASTRTLGVEMLVCVAASYMSGDQRACGRHTDARREAMGHATRLTSHPKVQLRRTRQ